MNRFIGSVSLLVRDYDEAITYFTECLGFTLREDTALPDGKRWVLVSPEGGTSLLLAQAANPVQTAAVGNQCGGRVFLILKTRNFKGDHARLQSKGVRFLEEPREEPYGTVAVFQDLYGNTWDLIEPKVPGARPPQPPFDRDSAARKVRMAEDAWNSHDPERVSLAYTADSRWRNRSEFINGRAEIVQFLKRKWAKELDYRLIKELWAFDGSRIAVRFAYEWHDDSGNWFRSYGNENWEFDEAGLMRMRYASINDLAITLAERKYRWPLGPRPDGHPGLSDLGL